MMGGWGGGGEFYSARMKILFGLFYVKISFII
jgi:hypothetical protein